MSLPAAEAPASAPDFSGGYDGANWIRSMHGLDLTPFQATVADILGFVWRGIYHLGDSRLKRVCWKDRMVELVVTGGLATFDSSKLTELVVLCHDAAIRFEVSPCSAHHVRLQFWPRQRLGRLFERHPTIEQAVAGVRSALTAEGQE